MNEEFKKIEQSLERVQPSTLSLTQKEALWSRVQSRLNEVPVESPYMIFSSVMHVRVLVPALLVIFIVSTGATTALADSVRPGDFLFAVDRAAERVRLSIVSETKKDDVRVAIADERVEELESLISDESSRRMARADTTRNAKQAPAPQTEMALFATQVVVDEDTTLTTSGEDSVHVPENPRFEDVMMVTNTEEPVVDEEVFGPGPQDEDTEQRNKDIETALMLVGDISLELKEKGNAEGHARIEKALDRLSEKVQELPFEESDSFRESIEHALPDPWINMGPVPNAGHSSEDVEATTTVEIEGEVRGDSVEIEEKEIPHIEFSRPKKDD